MNSLQQESNYAFHRQRELIDARRRRPAAAAAIQRSELDPSVGLTGPLHQKDLAHTHWQEVRAPLPSVFRIPTGTADCERANASRGHGESDRERGEA